MIKRSITFLSLALLLTGCRRSGEHEVINVLQNASELASAEFLLDKVVIADQSKKLLHLIPLKQATFFAHTQAILKTGVDFSQIQPGDIQIKNNTIFLVLPPIEIVDFSYPADKMQIVSRYTHLHTFGNTITTNEMDIILQKAQVALMETINHLHIRPASEAKVKQTIANLLKFEGFEHIVITFKNTDKLLMEVPENLLAPTDSVKTKTTAKE